MPSDGCDGPGRTAARSPGTDLRQAPACVVAHHDPGRVAGQALRRSGRNAHPVFEHRLAGLVGVGQDSGVHVDYHLIAFSRSAGIDSVVKRGLGEQRQGVGLLLLHRRRVGFRCLLTSPLVQGLAGRVQRRLSWRARYSVTIALIRR